MPKTTAELSLLLHGFHGFQAPHEPCRSRRRKITASSAMAARHQAAMRRRVYRFQVRNVLKNRRRFLGMGSWLFSWVASRGSMRDAQIFQDAVKWLISHVHIYEDSRPASRGDDSTR